MKTSPQSDEWLRAAIVREARNFLRYARMMRRIDPRWRCGTGIKGYAPYRREGMKDERPSERK